MRHTLRRLIHLQSRGLRKGDKYPAPVPSFLMENYDTLYLIFRVRSRTDVGDGSFQGGAVSVGQRSGEHG